MSRDMSVRVKPTAPALRRATKRSSATALPSESPKMNRADSKQYRHNASAASRCFEFDSGCGVGEGVEAC